MTVLVGIRCSDGVLVAADSAATFGASNGPTIGQQEVQKVRVIRDKIAYASTGAVGIAQLIVDSIATAYGNRAFAGVTTPEQMMQKVGEQISKLVAPFLHTAQMQRAIVGEANASLCKSLIAMPVNKRFELFTFDFNGAPERATEQLPFVALGSGQAIADPFLALLKRLLWPNSEPTLAEGRLVAVWAIDHVRRTNPGGVGGPIQLATLTNATESVSIAGEDEVNEHLQAVDGVLAAIVKQIRGDPTNGNPAPSTPDFAK